MATKRAAIYCRISSDREGAGLGVQRQQEDCEALAAQLGWTVVAIHTDNDLSAYSGKPRPGYRALLEDIRTGRANAVLVWHTDRLHRSPKELEEYVDVCEPRKVVTQTVRAGELDLATPSGRMVARQLGAVARYEVEQMSARIKRAKAQAAQQGRLTGGPHPYGWNFAPDGTVTLNEPVARLLAKAYTDILAGVSMGSIVKEWNAAGFRTATGREWGHIHARGILLRARNDGLIQSHGEIVGKSPWPRIVDEDIWRAVHDKLTDPARIKYEQSNRIKYLLAGIALCGTALGPEEICGKPLRCVPISQGHRKVYRCDNGGLVGHVSVSVHALDNFVTAKVLERIRLPGFLDRFREAATPSDEALERLRSTESALSTRIEQSLTAFANDPAITPAMLSTIIRELEAKRAEARKQLAALEAARHQVLLGSGEVAEEWDNHPIEWRRRVIRAVIAELVVCPTEKRGPVFDVSRVLIGWHGESLPSAETGPLLRPVESEAEAT